MSLTRWRALALLMTLLPLGGCITLAPKAKPVQMYTFRIPPARRAEPTGGDPIGVLYAHGAFQQESAGDLVLTITGDKAAYIAQTRWVAPATLLFRQAVATAFDRAAGPVRLDARGQRSRDAYVLRLDVRNFETRYDTGRDAAPTVLVRIHAVLTGPTPAVTSEKVFEARAPTASNRVGEIVEAYDTALGAALGGLVSWTDHAVSAGGRAPL